MAQRETIEQGVTVGLWATARLAAMLAAAAGLAACASISEKITGSAAEMPIVGLPAGVPERPAEQLAFPAVHDMPPPRNAAVLSEVEQQKMENDLVAARNAQRGSAGTPAAAQKKPVRQTPRVVPVSSSSTIY